jgi:hypothetical protein
MGNFSATEELPDVTVAPTRGAGRLRQPEAAETAATYSVRPKRQPAAVTAEEFVVAPRPAAAENPSLAPPADQAPVALSRPVAPPEEHAAPLTAAAKLGGWVRERGHAVTTVLLVFFTLLVYTRPADWWSPDWPLASIIESITFYTGAAMLGLFLPVQLITDGSLSTRPREFYYVLALLLMGALSIPLADQDRWWARFTFNEMFVRAVLVFIVIINAVRTERRWRVLTAVNWCVGVALAWVAFSDYLLGKTTTEGYRVTGALGGMFENPNDLSQHLVTMTPLAVAFFLVAPRRMKELREGSQPPRLGLTAPLILVMPRLARRIFYGLCAGVLLLGTMVTFSRSGFLATTAASLTLTWKLGRKHRVILMSAVLVFALGFLAAAPGQYRNRILSIVDDELEVAKGSAQSRSFLLKESVKVAMRHPVLGIGMGNFRTIYDLQTHNAYTQVAAEMGLIALAAYLFFIIAPLRRLYEIERATYGTPDQRRFYYLAVGLQASLVAYLVGSFFGSIAYFYHIYYLVGFAVSFRMIYYKARGLPVNALRLPEAYLPQPPAKPARAELVA